MTDDDILAAWAERAAMPRPISGADIVHGWGDQEVAFAVRRDDGFAVDKQDRGRWSTLGRFDTLVTADVFLVLCLGTIWRSNAGLGDPLPGEDPAATLTATERGHVVERGGVRALIAQRPQARRFGWIADKSVVQAARMLLG